MPRLSFKPIAALAIACGVGGVLLRRLFPAHVPPGVALVLVAAATLLMFVALLRWGDSTAACDDASPRLRRRYAREMTVAMGLYVLVLFASTWLLRSIDPPVLRAAIALLPVPPIALAVRAMIRYIRDIDEMQQRIELEAVCIATAFVSLLYMTGGFLQSARVIDVAAAAAMIWVFPLICLGYGVAKWFVQRRYR